MSALQLLPYSYQTGGAGRTVCSYWLAPLYHSQTGSAAQEIGTTLYVEGSKASIAEE